MELCTTGADDTRALAAAFALALRPGDVVSLSGDLGAGKTCFVQGAASALGVTDRVTSPTFVLMRQFDAVPPVVHIDAYRLGSAAEVFELDDDIFSSRHITFVEWGDRVAAALPDTVVRVEIYLNSDPSQRRFVVRGQADLVGRLQSAGLGQWTLQC